MAVAGTGPLSRLATELWRSEDLRPGPVSAGFAPHAILGGHAGESLSVVPLANRKVAAASMVRWTDATTRRDGLTRAAAWAGLRTGAAQPLLRARIGIRVTGGDGPTLHEYLAEAVGVDGVGVACAFGSERPNQKPVVRILDTSGSTRGFAKVGWNELTRRLVDTESQFLAGLAERGLRTMVVPKPLFDGTWNGRRIAVSSAVMGRWSIRRPDQPGLAVLQELAGLSDRFREPISTSRYRRDLAESAGDLTKAGPIESALRLIDDRWSDLEMEFGHWHGDWAPWNVARKGDRTIVWDWERTAPGVPVGFDALHFAFQPRFTKAEDPLAVLLDATAEVGPMLTGLGVTEAARPLLVLLYLTELLVRFSDSGHGQPAAAVPHTKVVMRLLQDAVRHFGN